MAKKKEFEEFDPRRASGRGQEADGGEQFEDFDVTQEPEAEAESSVEVLGGLSEKEDDLRTLMQARDALERQLLIDVQATAAAAAEDGTAGYGNITGVAIGEKEVDGNPTGQLAVVVYVKDKVNASQVSSETLVKPSVGGVTTDVQVTGDLWAHGPIFKSKLRPAPCGVSISRCDQVAAGTLGYLVTRQNRLFLLSNNHVLAKVNLGLAGDPICQQGRLDGGVCPADIIARLTQFIPINFTTGVCNFVDAAIAQTSPNLVDRRVLRGGVAPGLRQNYVSPVLAPALNMLVQKSGRTTQFTKGVINAISATINVSYAPIGGVARFCRQFGVRGTPGIFSNAGDSGSGVTSVPANRPVGLLFAGNAGTNSTFCNDISQVLAALAVTIVF